MSTHNTKGIVLRTVKYGETSIIASIYTELFGLQSYIVNGVRVTSKKGPGKANLFQPPAILDLVVYHSDLKNLQRVREYRWGQVYNHIFFHVFKNAVALFMAELLQRTLKQPEANPPLFHFIEDGLLHLDEGDESTVGNFPLYFALHLSGFYGFRFTDTYSGEKHILDLREGEFVAEKPAHPYYLDGEYSAAMARLLKCMQPAELYHLKLNQQTRRMLLHAFETFYALHVQDFGTLKTLPVLEAVLE